MKILVATGDERVSDKEFNWCDENEPVGFPVGVCDAGEWCGCAHSWTGMTTTKGTTYAVVTEVRMTKKAYKELIRDLLVKTGYLPEGSSTQRTDVRRTYFELMDVVEPHEVGTVLAFSNNGPVVAEARQEA